MGSHFTSTFLLRTFQLLFSKTGHLQYIACLEHYKQKIWKRKSFKERKDYKIPQKKYWILNFFNNVELNVKEISAFCFHLKQRKTNVIKTENVNKLTKSFHCHLNFFLFYGFSFLYFSHHFQYQIISFVSFLIILKCVNYNLLSTEQYNGIF